MREAFLADADAEHGNHPRLEARQLLVERGVRCVGAVTDHHEAGEGQAGEFIPRPFEGGAEARGRAGVFQVRGARHALGRGRKPEETKDEALRERVQERAVRQRKLLLDEIRARLPARIGDRHALGVVEQDAEEVLLRHGRLEDQDRAGEAEEQRRDDPDAQGNEHGPVAGPLLAPGAAIGDERTQGRERRHSQRQRERARQRKGEMPLLEDEKRVLEQELERRPHYRRILLGKQDRVTSDWVYEM